MVVQQFMASLSATQQDYSLTFSLLAIGEIGRGADLSSLQDLKPAVLSAFGHTSEEVKSAASYALGNIALGNLSEYLPFILHEIETQPRRQYLLLHSLKEVISAVSTGETEAAKLRSCSYFRAFQEEFTCLAATSRAFGINCIDTQNVWRKELGKCQNLKLVSFYSQFSLGML